MAWSTEREVVSIFKIEYNAILNTITNIILNGEYKALKKVEDDFDKLINSPKQYNSIDALIKEFDESKVKSKDAKRPIAQDVKSELIEGLKAKVDEYKAEYKEGALKKFAQSLDREELEKEFYKEQIELVSGSSRGTTAKFSYDDIKQLLGHYDRVLAQVKFERGYSVKKKDFQQDGKEFVKGKLDEALESFCLLEVTAERKTQRRKEPIDFHVLSLERLYDKDREKLDLTLSHYYSKRASTPDS